MTLRRIKVCDHLYIGQTGCVRDYHPRVPSMEETRRRLAEAARKDPEIARRMALWLDSPYWMAKQKPTALGAYPADLAG